MKKRILIVGLVTLVGLSCGGEEKAEEAAGNIEAEMDEMAAETHEMMEEMGDEMAAATGTKESIAKTLGVDLANLQRDESGLEYIVRAEGEGASPQQGQVISAHYTGYLLNGTKFDSSVDRGEAFQTPIGIGRVIQGWDIAFQDMKVGEKRVLFIPAELGYGARGASGVIPPNAMLVFDVELLDIVDAQ